MSQIFISHSSRNDFEAIAIAEWLNSNGWDDIFLDIHPDRGLVAGDRWEKALHEAVNRCDAVIFLVSQAWLASPWCLKEFRLAKGLGKHIIGILIEELDITKLPEELTSTWQIVDLGSNTDHQIFAATHPNTGEQQHVHFSQTGLQRLKAGLMKAGLAAEFFPWPPENDPQRPPYRGMQALDTEDSGIFFGREAPTINLLAKLRSLRELNPPRIMVILGASGAGKSSFLQAGILPRLQRDNRHYVTLPVIRPENKAIEGDNGLLESLSTRCNTLGIKVTPGGLRDSLAQDQAGQPRIADLLKQISDVATVSPSPGEQQETPVVVMAVDQGEELFASSGAEQAQRFLQLLGDLLNDRSVPLLVIFTIRSDSYDYLQNASSLTGIIQQTFSLTPMPVGEFRAVITGPAQRLKDTPRKLQIEPALVDTLLQDIETGGSKDALPLLAFTLERLYRDYGTDGDLTLAEYQSMGGLKGALNKAVEQAYDDALNDPKLPNDQDAIIKLIRRGLIPWLAGIDLETQAPKRRVANLSEIPAEAQPVITHLINQRLLITDTTETTSKDNTTATTETTRDTTIEPAHEALLRQWGLLKEWLEEDLAELTIIEALQRASREWASNNRDTAWLTHSAGRLEDAENIRQRDDLVKILSPTDWDYLAACRTQENELKQKELQQAQLLAEAQKRAKKRTQIGLVVALVLMVFAGIFGWQATEQRDKALLSQSQFLAKQAEQLAGSPNGVNSVNAILLALNGLPGLYGGKRPLSPHARNALIYADSENILQAVFQHDDEVSSAQFSPDGQQVVTASLDSTARVWEVATRQLLAEFQHDRPVISAQFSPDGQQVMTRPEDDRTIRVWEVATGQLLAEFKHDHWVLSAQFSPDSKQVVTASGLNSRVWAVDTGQLLAEFQHYARVKSAQFSPDGKQVVTASNDETSRVWDLATGQPLAKLQHNNLVEFAQFSPDGKQVVTVSRDKFSRVWDVATGQPVRVFPLSIPGGSAQFSPDGKQVMTTPWNWASKVWDLVTGLKRTEFQHDGVIESAQFSPDGKQVATASWDKTSRVWDAATGQQLAEFQHDDHVLSAQFSPDSQQVVTASMDKTSRVWVITEQQLAELQHDDWVYSAQFSPDGQQVVTASMDNTSRVWQVSTEQQLAEFQHDGSVFSAQFSPDGQQVVTASNDKTSRVWQVTTGQQVAEFQHDDEVHSAQFSPNGQQVVTASSDKTIRVWGVATARQLAEFQHDDVVISAQFSPDGQQVVTASKDKTSRVWDIATGQQLAVFQHDGDVWSAQFSPDGKQVVTASQDQTSRVWDLATGQQLVEFQHDGGVWSAQFSPDGQKVVTASEDGISRVWQVTTGQQLAEFQHDNNRPVISAQFSPDGQQVVTASKDNTSRVWAVATGQPLAEFQHYERVTSAQFSPDGQQVVTASWDGTSRVWQVVTDRAQAILDKPNKKPHLAKTCLTPSERKHYFLPELTDQQWKDRGCPQYASDYQKP
ncbi:MAG: beta-propeller domain-containing protein [Oceanobacter sp.]